MTDTEQLLGRIHGLLDRLEQLLPAAGRSEPQWDRAVAFRWRRDRLQGFVEPVPHPHQIALEDLRSIDTQKATLERNTRQFMAGLPANNALLWGSRGTGKSSLIKALACAYAPSGLRVLEVDKEDLIDLPDIIRSIGDRPEKFLLYCDDLSFEDGDPGYKALKSVLDGSLYAPPGNLVLYATSNRRHLMPEYMADNLDSRPVDGEIHPSEAVEEKISLSERFGLWLSFYPFKQQEYLRIAMHWLAHFDVRPVDETAARQAALRWALSRGSRSGRSAWQFARDWAGRHGIEQ